jgi:putative tryptophan/tyrosine transport system substrate-binding protein
MNRRAFISGLGGATVWPVAARAQQSEHPRRVGVIMSFAEADPEARSWIAAFIQRLGSLGWTDGRNVRIEFRWSAGDVEQLRAYATELAKLQPDAILSAGAAGTDAAQRATRAIPIVFVQVSDPVERGIVASLARPGGNVTGFTHFERMIGSKWLEMIKEIAPGVTRVAVIFDAENPASPRYVGAIESVASSLGVQLAPTRVHDLTEVQSTIDIFSRGSQGALIVLPSSFIREQIISLAAQYRLPAIYPYRYYVRGGGLLSYGINTEDQYRRAASYVDRILKGEKPADLPVQAPTKFELVINLKTAKALGLTVPLTLQASADEVIE